MSEGRLNQKQIDIALRKLVAEVVTSESDGEGNVTAVTNGDLIARLLLQKAVGGERVTRDAEGNKKTEVLKPEAWALQYIVERVGGKTPIAVPDQEVGVRASDKVRELARERLNKLATAASGPPRHIPK